MLEGRVNYILVGLFILLMIVVSVLTLYIFTKFGKKAEYKKYLIITPESISGLREGAKVYYKGVQVGKVEKISIDPEDQNTVKIIVLIDKKLKVIDGMVATLRIQGITGLSYINIEKKPGFKLGYDEKEKLTIIPMKPSQLQKITSSLPEIIENANKILLRIQEVLSPQNTKKINQLIFKADKLLAELNQAVIETQKFITEGKKLVKVTQNKIKTLDVEKINITIEKYQKVAKTLEKLISQLKILTQNADSNTLPKLNSLLEKLKETSQELKDLSHKLNAEPYSLINIKEIKPHPLEEKR